MKINTISMRSVLFVVVIAMAMLECACNQWSELGPHGSGRVSGIAAQDATHLWAASPGGGVWKTQDGGANWAWAGNNGLNDFTALDVVFERAPGDGQPRMFLRTWNGFWVSTDGGEHWTRTLFSVGNGDTSFFQPFSVCSVLLACDLFAKTPDIEPRPVAQMAFNDSTGSVVLTALPCDGLQYSTDDGTSFKQIWPFAGQQHNGDNCITSIAADEATGKVYFTTMERLNSTSGSHIFRSTQAWGPGGPPAGLTWEAVNNGIPSGFPARALAWGGSADRVMAVVTDIGGGGVTPYLFDGTTWAAKPFPADPDCSTFHSFSDFRSLAWGGGNDFFAGGVTFAYTPDAGNTWVCPPLNQQHVDIRAILPLRDLGRVFIGGDQSDLEAHFVISSYPWTPGVGLGTPTGFTGHGISSWQTFSLAVGRRPPTPRVIPLVAPERIIVAAQDSGDACSDDGGTTWSAALRREAQSVVWRQNNGNDTLYSYGILGTLERSDNAGSAATCANINFIDVSPPDSLHEVQATMGPHVFAVNPTNPSQVFILGKSHVHYTLDGGTSWTLTSFNPPGFPNQPALSSIFVDEDGVLYVGTQNAGAFICTDTTTFCNGSESSGTWTQWGLNSPTGTSSPQMITAIAESNAPASGPRNFWMATTDGVYRQLAGETGWTLVASTPSGEGAPPFVYNEVLVDPNCRTRVYAGLGYLVTMSRSRGGVQISSDNGNNWKSLSGGFGLDNVPITQIAIDPGVPWRVFASTYGRGVWDYDFARVPACTP